LKKKIVGIFFVTLMLFSTMTVILYSNNVKVEASDGEQQGNGVVNLDYNWVWEQAQEFANVIYKTDWSGEHDIPKGRSWATAGENYTIDNILEPNMNGTNTPCGLTEYKKLLIGSLPFPFRSRQYSSKIVVQNFGFSINNNSVLYRIVPKTEMFPLAVGVTGAGYTLTENYTFSNAAIKEVKLFLWEYIEDHLNVSCDVLNTENPIAGKVVVLNDNDLVPENQSSLVFVLNENPSCQQKIENITDADVVLIQNTTRGFTFQNATNMSCSIVKINGNNSNFTKVIAEIYNGSTYVVENVADEQTLVFSNFSNETCSPIQPWLGVIKRLAPSDPNAFTLFGGIGPYYDFFRLIIWENIYRWDPSCKGLVLSDFTDTHFMTHSVTDWNWFSGKWGAFGDRFWMPAFSVNKSIGSYLINNAQTAKVTGFIDQEYRQQTWTTPGVISHNVVAYRNISHSPNNAIAVISNRMDGQWGQTIGDSGVGGAIVLGIAKYFKDNNITPKYNLTFLFTTGEEYGFRGVQHFVDSHPNGTGTEEYNFVHFIGFDQLGFNYTNSTSKKISLEINTKNTTMQSIISAIAYQTNYLDRTHNLYNLTVNPAPVGGSEDKVWKENCSNTVLFGRDSAWDGYHRTGMNFQQGDSLNNIDRNDVNVTFELAWNVTKYFTVNPDCWFNNIAFSALDSPNDGDTLLDSIQTNFSICSILPSDRVRVDAFLFDSNDEEVASSYANYVISTQVITSHSITLFLPPTIAQGDYKLQLRLYNSTGWINKIVNIGGTPNVTRNSSYFYLYHPFGNPTPGPLHVSTEDMIRGSYFTANEYGTARNITAYVQANTSGTSVHSICLIYRKNDSRLIGRTLEINPATGATPLWRVYNFTTPYPVLEKNTEYVLVCWSNSLCNLYYDIIYEKLFGRYENLGYGPSPDPATWNGTDHQYYSIFCGYRNDTNPPWITNITGNPHTVGFGYNVTISADIMDNVSGVNTVTVNIGHPGGKTENDTMTHISGDTYQYVFNNTWLVGQYNYTIWATDNSNNTASSSRHHFHVSADATISIATLQDSYSHSEYINITDPPNPPENYTLVGRGLTWDEYYNAITGQNILEVSTGPINYQEDNGTWTPINNSISQLATDHPAYVYGYRTGNNRGLFGVYFKPNAQNEWPVAFMYNRTDDPTTNVIRSKLVGVGYVDPQSNWAYQYLQNVQSSQGQINGNTVTYPSVFTGTDVTWSYDNTELKEEITLNNATKTVLQNHPPSMYGLNNGSSYLVFITKLDHQNLDMYTTSGMLNGNVTISDTGVEFKDALGQFKCALPLGEAYELNNESVRQKLTYRIVHLNGNTYLLSGLKISDLNTMTFPVVIDPTLTVNSLSNDGYIYNSSTTYSTARNASSGTVDSSATYLSIGQKKVPGFPATYNIYRGFALFNTSTLPSNAYLDSAKLSLYKKDDYSTTDFMLTIQNGQPTYPHNPLQTGDYGKNHYSGNGGSLNTASFVNGRNNITLNNLSWINRNGITKLCLRSSRDINGTTPTGNEYVNVYSANAPLVGYVPKLIITYRNQSKIKNTGSTNIKGYLLIQVQFYNTSQGKWLVDNDTVNETTSRTINSGSQLALDTIFNGRIRASNLQHGTGTYRVYTAFRDPEGNILKTNTGSELKAWWQFSKT
jgi:hypothetical protein